MSHALSIGNVCNLCLFSFASEIETAEEQKYFIWYTFWVWLDFEWSEQSNKGKNTCFKFPCKFNKPLYIKKNAVRFSWRVSIGAEYRIQLVEEKNNFLTIKLRYLCIWQESETLLKKKTRFKSDCSSLVPVVFLITKCCRMAHNFVFRAFSSGRSPG